MTEITAGTTPIRTSVKANVASFTATAMSQAATSPMPPARAGPASFATTGVRACQIFSRIAGSSLTLCVSTSVPRASLRSIPEQNTFPACASTMTRTDVSDIAESRWAESCRRSCAESALRLCGESSVTVATPLATS